MSFNLAALARAAMLERGLFADFDAAAKQESEVGSLTEPRRGLLFVETSQ